MQGKLVLALFAVGCVALGHLIAVGSPVAIAGKGKNLKIYPPDTDKKVIKKDMKKMTKALGVECDHCHDKDAMDKDTKMKQKGRDMMRLTRTINQSLKKGGFDDKVTCMTCHRGKKKPAE